MPVVSGSETTLLLTQGSDTTVVQQSQQSQQISPHAQSIDNAFVAAAVIGGVLLLKMIF